MDSGVIAQTQKNRRSGFFEAETDTEASISDFDSDGSDFVLVGLANRCFSHRGSREHCLACRSAIDSAYRSPFVAAATSRGDEFAAARLVAAGLPDLFDLLDFDWCFGLDFACS
jgi:hypothetical protein